MPPPRKLRGALSKLPRRAAEDQLPEALLELELDPLAELRKREPKLVTKAPPGGRVIHVEYCCGLC